MNASQSEVVVTGNTIREFRGPAIVVNDSTKPAHVHGNTAVSKGEKVVVVQIQGSSGVVADNVVITGEREDDEK